MVSMLQMVNEAPFPGEIPLAQDRVAPSANRAEMDQITTQLSENEAQDQRLEEELAAVRSELDEAYALIASETPADAAQSESGLLGLEATQMLVELGEASVPHLARALTDDRPAVRLWAAETLGQIGPDAVEATDALLLAARDAVPAVRDAAHRALVRIDDSF
jgi:HEAT repeat protein